MCEDNVINSLSTGNRLTGIAAGREAAGEGARKISTLTEPAPTRKDGLFRYIFISVVGHLGVLGFLMQLHPSVSFNPGR